MLLVAVVGVLVHALGSDVPAPSGTSTLTAHLRTFDRASVVLGYTNRGAPSGTSHWYVRADGVGPRLVLDQLEGLQLHFFWDGQGVWETCSSERQPVRREDLDGFALALWHEMRSGLANTIVRNASPQSDGLRTASRIGTWYGVALPQSTFSPGKPQPSEQPPPTEQPAAGPPPRDAIYLSVRKSGDPSEILMVSSGRLWNITISDLDWAANIPEGVFTASYPEVVPELDHPSNHAR